MFISKQEKDQIRIQFRELSQSLRDATNDIKILKAQVAGLEAKAYKTSEMDEARKVRRKEYMKEYHARKRQEKIDFKSIPVLAKKVKQNGS